MYRRRQSERAIASVTFRLVLAFGLVCSLSNAIMTSNSIRRQAVVPDIPNRPPPPSPDFLSEELLPPPALSASFPTLRPRRPSQPQNPPLPPIGSNNIGGIQQPPRDLIPPFRPSVPNGPPRRPPPKNSPPPPPFTPSQPIPLLPPIEIPPERPLTDNEILATLVPKETSFIPTTGQGARTPSLGISIPSGGPVSASLPVSPVQTNPAGSNSSVVRFPTDSDTPQEGSPPPRNCPTCECTNEVDYICASNGVLYLNSCSFDCATFCDTGLRKVELELCASKNQ